MSTSGEANSEHCNHVSLISAFTPLNFCRYRENRKVSSPPESAWNNLIWADSAVAISKTEQHHRVLFGLEVSIQSPGAVSGVWAQEAPVRKSQASLHLPGYRVVHQPQPQVILQALISAVMPVWTQHPSPASYDSFSVIPQGSASVLPPPTARSGMRTRRVEMQRLEHSAYGCNQRGLVTQHHGLQVSPFGGLPSRPHPASWTHTFL